MIGEIAYEHCHRYAFACHYAHGRRVLDAACGEGYGSALLAEVAATVVGVDIDSEVVAHATARYARPGRLAFEAASVTRLPLADGSVDIVVSFETIEHLTAEDQGPMLAEFARVLAPAGFLILSSPNRIEYSEARGYANPFHLKELDGEELASLLRPTFSAQRWFRQRRYLASAIWSETPGERFEALSGSAASVANASLPPAMYFIVIAARAPEALPADCPALSLYADRDDAEWMRIDREAREVIRLDSLLGTRDKQITGLVKLKEELEAMVAHRDHVIAARDAEKRHQADLAEQLTAQLTAQIAAQERIIAFRESVSWWWMLPWLRLRRLWGRLRPS